MIIKLQKPTCPECKSKDIKIYLNDCFFKCNNCGEVNIFEIVWEEDQTFCNCDLCKTLNLTK